MFQLPMFIVGFWFGTHMNYKWWGTYLPFEGEALVRLLPPEAVPEYLKDHSGFGGIDYFLPWKSSSKKKQALPEEPERDPDREEPLFPPPREKLRFLGQAESSISQAPAAPA